MALKDAPLTLSEIIDYLERLREELLTVQRALEKLEYAKTVRSRENNAPRRAILLRFGFDCDVASRVQKWRPPLWPLKPYTNQS
jgi:hypothetical protein